jgi:hypothetical protein
MYNKKLIPFRDLTTNDLYIRKKIENHFCKLDIDIKYKLQYHFSKHVAFVLSLDNDLNDKLVPNISPEMKVEMEKGSEILPLIKKFKNETNFDEFYKNSILFYLKEECFRLEKLLSISNLENILKDTWEINCNFDLNIIINPLEGRFCGIGPSIGKNSYQVIGPPFEKQIFMLLAHEASHPYAKEYKRSSLDLIDSKRYFYDKIKRHKNWPKNYNGWRVCFEEHLVRCLECAYLDIILAKNLNLKKFTIKELLEKEKQRGFLYIDIFYKVINNHKIKGDFKNSRLVIRNILSEIECEHF